MATGISGSICLAPLQRFQFANANVGDLVIRGLNGGDSQKILLGTQSGVDAEVTVVPGMVTINASMTLSNALADVILRPGVVDGDQQCIVFNRHIVPDINVTRDLGSSNNRFRHLYLSGSTLYLGSNALSCTVDGGLRVVSGDSNIYVPVNASQLVVRTSNLADGLQRSTILETGPDGSTLMSLATAPDTDANPTIVAGTTSRLSSFFADPVTRRVGLNTLTPQFPLDVIGDANIGGSIGLSNATGIALMQATGSNLGINCLPSTQYNLDIFGNARVSGTLSLAGVSMAGTLNTQGDIATDSDLFVDGTTTLTGQVNTSNGLYVASDLRVMGTTTLSNAATIYGVLAQSNAAYFSSNISVQGAATLSNDLKVVGVTTLSNAATIYGVLTQSNAAYFSSNVVIEGSLDVKTINYSVAHNNLTIYTNEEIRSNLVVEGSFALSNNAYLQSNVDVYGVATLSNSLRMFGDATLYDAKKLTLSNASGSSTVSGLHSNVGINNASPVFTLDVNGDINFSGKIYQQGAIFSGWSSNANGNYILSNAAFKGPATSNDVMLLYTYPDNMTDSNLALTLSNASGRTSMYALSNNLGFGKSNPVFTVDVNGDVRATSGLYADGTVAVGTYAPSAPVDVQINTAGISINCSAKVVASEFCIFSDARIKKDVRTRDPNEYLAIINGVQVREYAYIDPVDKGNGIKTGFIAQEVEAVAPMCVETVSEYLPNIFESCAIRSVDVRIVTVDVPERVVATLAVGDSVKMRSTSVGRLLHGVVLSVQGTAVAFDMDGDVSAADETIFVVGKKVGDFKMLNHEQLNSVAIGAIKAQQQRIVALEAAVAELRIAVAV